MIILHHLNASRSMRIMWLMEELGVDYQIDAYERDAKTRLAPVELEKIHPLGKSPVITDADIVIHETGAIVDYLIKKYGNGKLSPDPQTADYAKYSQWLHYAEGSAMLPLMLKLYTSMLGDAAKPLHPRIASEINRHFSYINNEIEGKTYFLGEELTGADIIMSFPVEAARAYGVLGPFDGLSAWLKRIHARPAFQSALEKAKEKDNPLFA